MDPFTLTLTGVTLWRSGLVPRQTGVWGILTLLLACNIADAEGMIQIAGAAPYVRNYHGPTHSLVGSALLALAVAAIATWGLKRAGQHAPFKPFFTLAVIGVGAHLLLDGFQGYGEALLWPAYSKRFVLPLMAAYDVANFAVFFLALGIPLLLNAVNAEIGAKRVNPAAGAMVGLVVLAMLIPARYALRLRADYAAASGLVEEQESYSVHPSPFLPWRWYLVQDTPAFYLVQDVDAISQTVAPGIVRIRKPAPNNLLIAARDTASAQAFLDMAMYPIFTLEEGHRGVIVRLRDLQFYVAGGSDRPYSLEVEVNSQGKVLAQRAQF